jgi:hypothetical protein
MESGKPCADVHSAEEEGARHVTTERQEADPSLQGELVAIAEEGGSVLEGHSEGAPF